MPKYKCSNDECTNYNTVMTKSTVIKVIDGKVVDSAKKCLICGNDMEVLPTEGYTTNMHGSMNICKK